MRRATASDPAAGTSAGSGSYARISRAEKGRMVRARARARRRKRRLAMITLLLTAAILVGFDLFRSWPPQPRTSPLAVHPTTVSASPGPAEPTPSISASPSPSPSPPPPVLRMSGDFPKSGPGSWSYATRQGKVLGSAGGIRRFRVAVESNLADEELDGFTSTVDAALGDERSWIAGKRFRVQRVAAGSPYDFTVLLATAETTRRLCATGGMDTRLNGVSFTSCRLPGRVVVNLDRWRLSVDHFVKAKVPLRIYRYYVINHEVGHELGHQHEACTGNGRPAPVMQQQTYGFRGCVANPWPYLDGERYAGPMVS